MKIPVVVLRRSIGWMGTDVSHPEINATVNAIDAHYFSADQRWALDGQFMHSDVSGITGMGFLRRCELYTSSGSTTSYQSDLH